MSIQISESGNNIDFSPLQFSIKSEDLFKLFVQSEETHTYGSFTQLSKIGGKNQLLKELRVTISKGLPFESNLEHHSRLSAFGSNELPRPQMKSFWHFIKEQFRQFCIQVLLICSILVFGIAFLKREGRRAETFSEAGILFLAVVFVVIIGSVTDYGKEREFQQILCNQFIPECSCVRSGTIISIPSTKLLVGDIVILSQGDHVFADCLFLEGSFLMVDQSSLTGETELVQKTAIPNENINNLDNDPFILSGCNVMEGQATVVVCAVGSNTQTGSLRKQIDSQEFFESLILAEDVNNLAKFLIIVGGVLACVMFTILSISLIIHVLELKGNFFSETTLLIFLKIFMESFLVLVLSVPEGLPMIFTLSLAYAVHEMQKKKIVFRKLNACDVMGGCTDLIFDKTGTLSKGKLNVNKIFLYNQTLEQFESAEFRLIFSEFADIIALSCQQQENHDEQTGQRDSLKALNSNITQTMIKFLAQQTYNYINILQTYKNQIVETLPQQSKTDYNARILKITDSHFRCIFKGNPEFIIQNSKYIRIGTQSMQLSTFSQSHKEFLLTEVIQNFSENCIQIIGYAYYDYSDSTKKVQQMLGQITFLGLVGIHEEYRDNIDGLFETMLNEVKIAPRIVTGDQYLISYKLLNSCRLLTNKRIVKTEQNLILSGKQFEHKLQQSESQFCEKILLIYRATPDQKEQLVKNLMQKGKIVGYIGDGINDAQALKAADISICMGVNAAQIAQENSQVILQDDNLDNLIIMLQWGRTIYENIQRFIWYQLTFCIVSIFYMLYASLTVGESPFSVIQIIWLSLIHDVFSSLALATESPSKNVFKTPTFKRNEYIISTYVFIMIGLQIVYQLTVLLTLHAIYMETKVHKSEWTAIEKWKEREHIPNTILFACLGWLQITSLICSRRIQKNEYNILENISSNTNFVILIGFVICAQCAILFFGGRFFEIAELDIYSHLLCLALGLGSYVWFISSKQLIQLGETIILKQKHINKKDNNLIEGEANENGEFLEDAELIYKN